MEQQQHTSSGGDEIVLNDREKECAARIDPNLLEPIDERGAAKKIGELLEAAIDDMISRQQGANGVPGSDT